MSFKVLSIEIQISSIYYGLTIFIRWILDWSRLSKGVKNVWILTVNSQTALRRYIKLD